MTKFSDDSSMFVRNSFKLDGQSSIKSVIHKINTQIIRDSDSDNSIMIDSARTSNNSAGKNNRFQESTTKTMNTEIMR